MNSDENVVLTAEGYNKIDGYDAYVSAIKRLTLGLEKSKDMKKAKIAAKMWKNEENEDMTASATLELHQALDLAVFACRCLEYFQEAYWFPKLYDPENPSIDRIGLQGDSMSVSVCTDNPMLDKDIQDLSLTLGNQGEMIGERLRVLSRLLKEMGY